MLDILDTPIKFIPFHVRGVPFTNQASQICKNVSTRETDKLNSKVKRRVLVKITQWCIINLVASRSVCKRN